MNLRPSQAILTVDDDPTITDTFSRMLQHEGFTVYAAINPKGALEIAADKLPDAIILDLRMPLVSGLQFLQHPRETPALQRTPVAVVTGDYFVDAGTASEIEALGASILFEPLWLEDLLSLARSLTEAA
jgi:CheY-like chemotaxis protein